jgi:hypothetical protein
LYKAHNGEKFRFAFENVTMRCSLNIVTVTMRYFLEIVTVTMSYFLNIVTVTMRYSLNIVTVTMSNLFLKGTLKCLCLYVRKWKINFPFPLL